MPEIVGHRGFAARAPENTLVSLDMAIEAGADTVEWDVQVAACGTPVLLHDDTLDRTTDGRGPVAAVPLAGLRKLDAGCWFGPAFEGERIPSLAEALERVRGRVARAFCEVKSFREPRDVDRVVEIVRTAGMLGDVVFISLEWEIVERVARLEPEARIGFILADPSGTDDALARVARLGRGLVDADARVLLSDPTVAGRVVDAGVELGSWTVNDPRDAEALAARGVTSFTTDEVDRLLDWRAERSA